MVEKIEIIPDRQPLDKIKIREVYYELTEKQIQSIIDLCSEFQNRNWKLRGY